MILHKTILILEDDLRILSKILDRLSVLEDDQPYQFSAVIFTNYLHVQQYVNDNPKAYFDMILLDRDCKLGGSFHVIDLERFGAEKVIAISSVPKWNEEAKKRGVTVVVEKDYKDREAFADTLLSEVAKMLRNMPPNDTDFHQIT